MDADAWSGPPSPKRQRTSPEPEAEAEWVIDTSSSHVTLGGVPTKPEQVATPVASSSPPKPVTRPIKEPRLTRQAPLYDNCQLQSPGGTLLCNCPRRKIDWYVARDLADIIREDPVVARLRFKPAGPGRHGDDFYLAPKTNECVGCGALVHLVRHNIVPSEYRRFFPLELKAHKSHDVVLLCVSCQSTVQKLYKTEKDRLAQLYNAPIRGNGPRRVKDKALDKAAHLARALCRCSESERRVAARYCPAAEEEQEGAAGASPEPKSDEVEEQGVEGYVAKVKPQEAVLDLASHLSGQEDATAVDNDNIDVEAMGPPEAVMNADVSISAVSGEATPCMKEDADITGNENIVVEMEEGFQGEDVSQGEENIQEKSAKGTQEVGRRLDSGSTVVACQKDGQPLTLSLDLRALNHRKRQRPQRPPTLTAKGRRVPPARIIEMIAFIADHLKVDKVSLRQLQELQVVDPFTEMEDHCDHGLLVVQHLTCLPDFNSFIKNWRQLFVNGLSPRRLPAGWAVDYEEEIFPVEPPRRTRDNPHPGPKPSPEGA